MGLAEGLIDLAECLYLWIRKMFCKHQYQSGWMNAKTGQPAKVCRKCNKIVIHKGGIPKLDTPILSEEDVKDLND